MNMMNNGLLSYKHLSKINRWQKYSSDIYVIWYIANIIKQPVTTNDDLKRRVCE